MSTRLAVSAAVTSARGEQRQIGVGVGPPDRRHEQLEGLLLPGSRYPVAVQRDAQAQDRRGPGGIGDRVLARALQVGMVGFPYLWASSRTNATHVRAAR
jgi:hypothetical protein